MFRVPNQIGEKDMNQVATPAAIEARLVALGKELDDATDAAIAAEVAYLQAKPEYEIAVAKARMDIAAMFADRGVKATVQEKEDEALISTSTEYVNLGISEAAWKAAKANVARINTHIDIARTVSASVRSSLAMS
jgi:hypothetical protein